MKEKYEIIMYLKTRSDAKCVDHIKKIRGRAES